MTEELISVIVPVYNAASYLDRCVKSIVDQTYKNLEIILVDDGSTDGSGAMCDIWAEKDSRIQVIHKPNGGPSEARNAGIDLSTGDWLSFADSDDWLDTAMLETLYMAIRNNQGVNMAVCGFAMVFGDKIEKKQCSGRIYMLTCDEAIHDVLYKRLPISSASSCNKLYARYLWDAVRFPVGMYYEDAYIRSRMYVQCEKIAVVDKSLYFYYQRKDSTMHLLKLSTVMDGVNALLQECEFLCGQYPHLRPVANSVFLNTVTGVYSLKWKKNKSIPPETDRYLRTLFKQYKKGTWKYLLPRQRMTCVLFSISPALMCVVLRMWSIFKQIQPWREK